MIEAKACRWTMPLFTLAGIPVRLHCAHPAILHKGLSLSVCCTEHTTRAAQQGMQSVVCSEMAVLYASQCCLWVPCLLAVHSPHASCAVCRPLLCHAAAAHVLPDLGLLVWRGMVRAGSLRLRCKLCGSCREQRLTRVLAQGVCELRPSALRHNIPARAGALLGDAPGTLVLGGNLWVSF